ncbi:VanZ family protein [Chryseobacterium sp. A301]
MPIYWAFLTYMLLRPGVENPVQWFLFPGIDKVIHMLVFSMLAFCFLCAFPKIKFFTFLQVMILYALLTEIWQDEMGLGRSLEFYDLVADSVGVLLGAFVFQKVKSISFRLK